MKISEIIANLNGEMKMPELAAQVGMSKDTLRRHLKSVGYSYDNSQKQYFYEGDLSDKDNIDGIDISEITNKKVRNKSDKIQKKEVNKNDLYNIKVLNKEDNSLSEDEVEFIKKLYSEKGKIEFLVELSMLPDRDKTKKSSIEISQETHDDFDEFSKGKKFQRFSKNDLIEIALLRFMREHRNI
ncbi:AraC family transcriptional regulator [Bacillus infantis]|uniref:AraC family transcriptional regulator n=1 Tax=Bacillus infantis TaxID=324767 RepID=UPI00101D9B65|nr:AraC family transcriptional regulator [Bacillus infantis]RYI24970.1 AraC family transcriptional regulator [Bacillus infantis]